MSPTPTPTPTPTGPAAPAGDAGPARDYDRVAAAIAYLDEHAGDQPTLDDVARHLHLSAFHTHRLFSRYAGTSPKRFLRWLTAGAARDLLRERRAVLDVAHAAGLSSAGRLHDLVVSVDAMTPGEVGRDGAGLTVRVATHPTPLGPAAVGVTERGVCLLRFVDDPGDDQAVALVAAQWPAAAIVIDRTSTRTPVDAAFGAATAGSPIPLAVSGTNLQLKVWEALLSIPSGQVTTYGDLARSIARPEAHRAVASAVARNPVAVLIPCHRVLRGTGQLAGYRWGLERKRVLLASEAAARDAAEDARSARGHRVPAGDGPAGEGAHPSTL